MTQEDINKQIDRLTYKYWTCKDENEAAYIENELDYFYSLLNKRTDYDTGR